MRRATAVVAALVSTTALGLLPLPSAYGAWSTPTQRSAATVAMARLGTGFTLVSGGGTAGASYSGTNMLGTQNNIVDLVNTGTVPGKVSGVLTLRPVVSGMVSVSTCSVAWSGTTCPGTTRTIASTSGLGDRVVAVGWGDGGALPAGGAVHIKVTLSGALYNQALLTAVASHARGPKDRTLA